MVTSCSALNCTSRFVKHGNVRFHRIPKDPALRKKWVVALRRKDFTPSATAVICSKHFKDTDYIETVMGTLRLKDGAVPSIFDFPQHLLKVESARRPLRRQTDSCTKQLVELPSTSSSSACSEQLVELPSTSSSSVCIEQLVELPSTSYNNENPPTLTEHSKVGLDVFVRRINRRRKRDPIYLGDFEESDLECPVKRKRYWQVSQEVIKKKNAANQILSQQNRSLIREIKNLNAVIDKLKSKNKLTCENSLIWWIYKLNKTKN